MRASSERDAHQHALGCACEQRKEREEESEGGNPLGVKTAHRPAQQAGIPRKGERRKGGDEGQEHQQGQSQASSIGGERREKGREETVEEERDLSSQWRRRHPQHAVSRCSCEGQLHSCQSEEEEEKQAAPSPLRVASILAVEKDRRRMIRTALMRHEEILDGPMTGEVEHIAIDGSWVRDGRRPSRSSRRE